tara:strand:- start:1881 stop:2138 length:258 start_codon:yes stop_codon:yes gene_type:complete
MRKKLIIATSFIIIAITLFYVNSSNNNFTELSKSNFIKNKKFQSGITIKDIGEMVIIEQKPNEATVIIDKDDLDSIIAFLNSSNE